MRARALSDLQFALMVCPQQRWPAGWTHACSLFEGSNVLANWALDIGSTVDTGGGDKAREAEDVLGTIAGSRGSSGTIASARGKRQW